LSEFTGERVIPELVNADLLNEHLSRYRFAKHFISGWDRPANVLDAGCGSGYGAAELAEVGSVTGADISAEAVAHAQMRYSQPGVRFLQASCEALPFSDATFDLVVAFEVIEHLDGWQQLLAEAYRVLNWSGVLLVSTPNRDYYAESRGEAGPNPFHRHEFDYKEFRAALETIFPHVRIWVQNHAEAIVFTPQHPAGSWLEAPGGAEPAGANFYLAACSQAPITGNTLFAWLPSSANLLQEREQHIAKLNGELSKKDSWLRQTLDEHSTLQQRHEALTAELEQQNHWAGELNQKVADRDARIGQLQEELESQNARAREAVARLESEQTTRLAWIADLESQIAGAKTEIERLSEQERLAKVEAAERNAEAQAIIDRLENTVTERTEWAQRLDGELEDCREELSRIKSSNWYRAGANLGLGPRPRGGK
jgi:ubiquinone/menaquinone biosynthesis C-methylase UbiE/predicted  nucleic acid-binding Zn-ribbon protein